MNKQREKYKSGKDKKKEFRLDLKNRQACNIEQEKA